MTDTIIEIRDLEKRREQGGIAFELWVPELCLGPGQFVAIVGESGCGKSTLLDMLALVSRPSRASVFRYHFGVMGRDDRPLDIGVMWQTANETALAAVRRTHLGYVLQTGGLLPFLTVDQNIRLPLSINARPDAGHVRALADRIGVGGVMAKKPQYLSGGQRQRVAIVRAMAHRPRIILADEPTAAVDRARARAIVSDFDALARDSGTTIIMVTHDRDLVKGIADVTCTFAVEAESDTLVRSRMVQGGPVA